MKRIRQIAGILLTGLILPGAAAASSVTIRVGNWLPPHHLIVQGIIEPWKQAIELESGGEIKIEIMRSGVAKPAAYYNLVESGAVDVGYAVAGYNRGRFPLTQIMDLPFMSPDPWAGSAAAWLAFDAFDVQAKEHPQVQMLGLWVVSNPWLSMRGEPLRSFDQLQGKKIRVAGSAPGRIISIFGGTPVQLPATEAQQAMASGVVDGIASALESVGFFNMAGSVKGATSVAQGLYNDTFWFGMNKKKGESLSEEHRRIISKHSGLAIALMAGRAWTNGDALTLAQYQANGAEIVEMPEAEIEKARQKLSEFEEEWLKDAAAKNVDGKAMLAYARAMVAALRQDLPVNRP